MTDIIQAIWLALIQGLTEFLPISSSGHLVLIPRFLGWEDQGLAFDVAVHVGTLFAVCLYFRDDIRNLTRDWVRSVCGGPATNNSRLFWSLIVAVIPVGLAGLFLGDFVTGLRTPIPIAVATIGFGLLLGWFDWKGKKNRILNQVQGRDVLVIGCAQVLALIPGTSRSGITITAAMAMGLTREASARFSFLLAIPVIVLAGGWEGVKLIRSSHAIQWEVMLIGTIVSMVTALLCIRWFMGFVQKHGMLPFVLYRILLGILILVVFI